MGGYLVAKEFLQNLWKTMHSQFSLVDDDVLEEHRTDDFELLVEQARQHRHDEPDPGGVQGDDEEQHGDGAIWHEGVIYQR